MRIQSEEMGMDFIEFINHGAHRVCAPAHCPRGSRASGVLLRARASSSSRAQRARTRAVDSAPVFVFAPKNKSDENKGIITPTEFFDLTLMPDDEDKESLADILALKEHYMKDPDNAESWHGMVNGEFGGIDPDEVRRTWHARRTWHGARRT